MRSPATFPVTSWVVELCGLPGSGKSTVAEHAREQILARGVECVIADAGISATATRGTRVAHRTAAAARETARHPLASIDAARSIVSSGQPGRRDTAAGLAQWLAVRDLISRARSDPRVWLLEEGVIQTMWTLALRADRDPSARLWRYLGARSLPDLVLVLDAPAALAADRLETRESRHSRSQDLPPGLRLAELERGRECLDRLLADSPVPVQRIAVGASATPTELGECAAAMVLRSAGHPSTR